MSLDHQRVLRRLACIVLFAWVVAAPATAQKVQRTLPFEVDQWIDLEVVNGAITLHRFRIVRDNTLVEPKLLGSKPDFEFHDGLQFQLEFTNDGDYNWKADVRLEWKDDREALIEGMSGQVTLNKRKRHHVRKVTDVALRYGIQRAQQLELKITVNPN
ncbi:MAG: hypothetical protein AAF690_16305 [Acidobacteriota bacterium]